MVAAAALSGCGSESEISGIESGKAQTEAGGSASTGSEAVTIDEQVIFDYNGLTITATEYVEDEFWGDSISVLIENNGTADVGISMDELIINNYMVSSLFSETVTAGNKANASIDLYSTELEVAGIENVGQIELYLHLFDPTTYMTSYTADVITIQISAFETMDTTPNDDDTELYNAGGIRVVGKYVDEGSFWGNAIVLYLENTSGQNITISVDEMAINGHMVDPLFVATVYNGKMAVEDITIFDTELEENGIESIETVEFSFHIYNSDTYADITYGGPVTFTVE